MTWTLFAPLNLALVGATLIAMTVFGARLQPAGGVTPLVDWERAVDDDDDAPALETPIAPLSPRNVPAQPLVNLLVGGCGLVWIVWWFGSHGLQGVNLNSVNFSLFLILGVLLHQRPAPFLAAAERGGRYVWGVILQFPFYAGIFGIIRDSKLQDVIAGWFTAVSKPDSYPLLVLWYSGILNYIIPSGGSKWAIEAPYIV